MLQKLFAVLLFLIAAPLHAQQPITILGKSGKLVKIEAKATGDVTWYLDQAIRSPDQSFVCGKTLLLTAPGGKYLVLAISAESSKATIVEYVVIVEGGPLPPSPDSWTVKLKTAYDVDLANKKADKTKSLASVFREMAASYIDTPSLKTVANVNDLTWAAAKLDDQLPSVASVIKTYLAEKIPSGDLTPEIRSAMKTLYVEVATALESLIGPTPPGPGPIPVPGILGDGFKVLIVEETGERNKLTPGQIAILTGQAVRGYLKTKGDFRIFDKDVNFANEAKGWQDGMKRPRQSLPWIIISTPQGSFEGPLPATVDDALKLLKKYGGE